MKVLRASVFLTCMIALRRSAVTAFRGIPLLRNAPRYNHGFLSRRSRMSSKAYSASKSSSFEVEEKFVVPINIEECLLQWEFVKHRQLEMIDWYFDTPSLELLQQNVWLRCRQSDEIKNEDEPNFGQWQIKIGQQQKNDDSATLTATVYVELEGVSALEKAASYLHTSIELAKSLENPDSLDDNSSLFAKHIIPQVPALGSTDDALASQLVPLAKIFARRTSWTNAELNIRVDLDETDFGHAVGEVEMVVEDEACVDSARTQVREWVKKLQGPNVEDSSSSPILVMGKLEYYLYHYRPQVYSVCVQSGVLG